MAEPYVSTIPAWLRGTRCVRSAYTTNQPRPIPTGIRIVVVDDHEDHDLLEQAFTFVGAAATTVATAEEALPSAPDADVISP